MALPSRLRRDWVEKEACSLSLNQQLQLLGLSKASYYYEPVGETAENLALMELIDEIYTRCPFYGSRRMMALLQQKGHEVNRKRIIRLMQKMGLQAVFPKPSLSKPDLEHEVFPYLLNDLEVNRADQVWCSDITYIRVDRGYLYLTVVMDWHTRYVLSWRLSNTLDASFCVAALQEALEIGRPEVFNTDQGSQYTSRAFTQVLKDNTVQISMDGKGRAFDNIFIERLWRSVKYEEVYLKRYETGRQALEGLSSYLAFYNNERPHQSLDYQTPRSVYLQKRYEKGSDAAACAELQVGCSASASDCATRNKVAGDRKCQAI